MGLNETYVMVALIGLALIALIIGLAVVVLQDFFATNAFCTDCGCGCDEARGDE